MYNDSAVTRPRIKTVAATSRMPARLGATEPPISGSLSSFLADSADELGQDVQRQCRHQAEDQNRGGNIENARQAGSDGTDDLEQNGDFAADDRDAKENPDTIPFDVLGGHRSDLRANRGAHEHDERGQKLGPALVAVRTGAIQTRDGHFKQVGAHRNVSRTTQQIDQRRHAEQAAANAQNPGQRSSDKTHRDGQPDGTANARPFEMDHRRNLDLVKLLVPLQAGSQDVQRSASGVGFPLLLFSDGQVDENHARNQRQQHDIAATDIEIDLPDFLQPHDHLCPGLKAADGTDPPS